MGMGTVFFGLICLIFLTYLTSRICLLGEKNCPAVPAVPTIPAAHSTVPVRQEELVAAVSAALAEELGTDITGIRILSMKKV